VVQLKGHSISYSYKQNGMMGHSFPNIYIFLYRFLGCSIPTLGTEMKRTINPEPQVVMAPWYKPPFATLGSQKVLGSNFKPNGVGWG